MATTPTAIGPIGARQINRNLYVGQSDLVTIQVAVNVAAKITGFFMVVVPYDYKGTDQISAVTGATTDIEILDQRLGQWQVYFWNGTQYIPRRFQQMAGFIASGMPSVNPTGSAGYGYDHAGGLFGAASINASAVPGGGLPSVYITGYPSDGGVTPAHTWIVCEGDATTGDPRTLINGTTLLLGDAVVQGPLGASGGLWTEVAYIGEPQNVAGNKYMLLGTDPTANLVQIQGQTVGGIYDQTLQLNPQGGNVEIGNAGIDSTAVMGAFHVNGPTILYESALIGGELGASGGLWTEVAYIGEPQNVAGNKYMLLGTDPTANLVQIQGQTVGGIYDQTLQLNPQGGNVEIANAGGTVSVNGSPVRTFANTPDGPGQGMVWPPDGIAVSVGDHWQNPSINPASLATWPPAGIAVSTGTAWGTPIDPATLPRLSSGNLIVTGSVTTTQLDVSNVVRVGPRVPLTPWQTGSANMNADVSNIAINAPNGAGAVYLNPDQGTGGVKFCSGAASTIVGSVDGAGNATFAGNLIAGSSTGYIGNVSTPSPLRIMTGYASLVAGTFTVTFAKPFTAGIVTAYATVISAASAGTSVPTVWVQAGPTALIVNASSASATNQVYWVIMGPP